MRPALFLLLAIEGFAQARPVTRAEFDRWMKDLSNWGRWGANDQLGAVNLITPRVRRDAAALVREGVSISLSRDAGPFTATGPAPTEHRMMTHGEDPRAMFATDSFLFRFHGALLTHLDTMAHMLHGSSLYNGYGRAEVSSSGARKLDVQAYKSGFFSRGVLIDIPLLKGVRYLEPGTPVYPEDLDAWEKRANLRVRSGDIVFLRTGRWTRAAERGSWDTDRAAGGLHASCARWLKSRDVAVLGSDAHAELMPSPVAGVAYPVHALVLTAMGVPMFDNCDLEPLAAASAGRGRWEFLLTAAPVPVKGGTGSPLNPVATF